MCIECRGNKFTAKKEIVEAKLEKGVKSGECIVLKNKGDESDKYIEPGDIYIVLREKQEKNMKRVGNNLHVKIPILLSEALSKFSIRYEHPNGETILIENNYIIKPDSVHIINNLGFTSKGIKGDLIIEFDIIFPDRLDEKRTELIKKLLPKRKEKDDERKLKLKSYQVQKHRIKEENYQNISHEHAEVPDCATQ